MFDVVNMMGGSYGNMFVMLVSIGLSTRFRQIAERLRIMPEGVSVECMQSPMFNNNAISNADNNRVNVGRGARSLCATMRTAGAGECGVVANNPALVRQQSVLHLLSAAELF